MIEVYVLITDDPYYGTTVEGVTFSLDEARAWALSGCYREYKDYDVAELS